MLGIGAIIGTGIFVLTGQAAAAHAGPAVVLSMIIAGLASALAAICYAEFASSVPVAGSAYTYGYATLGELVAWIIGWDLVLEYALGAATVAVGWSGYVVSFLADIGITFPPLLSAAPGTAIVLADGGTVTALFNLPAILISTAATALLVIGIRESARVNAVIVVIKVAVVLLIIGLGGMFVDPPELAAVHAAEHRRVWRVRVERRAARRRRDLLRLHRLRRGLHRGAGIEEPAARHAARHHRVAGDLHRAVCAGVGRDGRPRAVSAAGRAGADGGGGGRRARAGGGHVVATACST